MKSSGFISFLAGVIAFALGVIAAVDGRGFDATLGFTAAGMAFIATAMIWRKKRSDRQ